MKDEIKEIDITKDLYLCSPLLNTECSKENCYINNGPCCHTVNKEHSQQHLLDYITNLQEENEYSDYCNEKLREKIANLEYKITNLQEENEKIKRTCKLYYAELGDYEQKIDKAIEHIEEHQLIYTSQYEEESNFDNHLLEILQGKSDE